MVDMNKDHEVVEVLWEHRMSLDGEDHYKKTIENKAINETKLGEQLLQQIALTVEEQVSQRQASASKSLFANRSGKREHWCHLLPMIKSYEAAFCITESLMFELSKSKAPTYHHVCLALSESFIREIRFQNWRNQNKGYASYFLKKNSEALASKSQHLRFARKMEKKIEEYLDGEDYDLGRRARLSLGALLFDCIKAAQPDLIEERAGASAKGSWKASVIYWTDSFLDDISRLHAVAAVAQPVRRPMLVPPRAWKRNSDGKIKGGYYLLEQKVYRTDWQPHLFNPSEKALEGLNIIQSTPWRVCDPVFQFLKRNPLCAPQYPRSKPKKMAKQQWDGLDEDTKIKVQQQFSDDLAIFTSNTSKAMTFERQMLQACELEGKIFWQPHAFDFRGRLYPSNQMLTSQGDHVARGLIQFANGKRVGADGINALKLQVANTFGWDKELLEVRIANVDGILDEIMELPYSDDIANNLIEHADEPMAFYAAAWELSKCLSSDNPEAFVSYTPISVDGVTNGLQLLSLLSKDVVGAEKTNCTAAPARNDLYMEVAEAVKVIMLGLREDPNTTKETLQAINAWWPKMQDNKKARQVTKRPLMTTSYGVTKEGIREQLVADRLVDDLIVPECFSDLTPKRARHKLAGYMRDWIVEGRVSAVAQSVVIMDYLKETAKVLAENDLPLSWVTPDQCEISQKYVVLKDKNVRTFDNWMRRLRTRTNKLSPSKNAGAAAPNVVHSLDASMLRMTAVELSKLGISDMAFVHDSYAVHCCHLDSLNFVLRQVAVDIFKGNWLQDSFYEGLVWLVDDEVSLPKPPPQGSLDVENEIPNALYFFS